MINIRIYRENGSYDKYKVSGHANYDIDGKDIVCAAVSAITQTILITLDIIAKIKYEIRQNEGYLEVIVLANDKELGEVQVLFKALEIGIKAIEDQYPEHVNLEIINKTP